MASLSTQCQAQNFGQEKDCTGRCRSQTQALQLISAIIKGTQDEINSYCRYLCSNFALLTDTFGRSLLHVASSCGKVSTVSWLLENCHSKIDAKDKESGWTALHRALFYGQLSAARVLLNHKANSKLLDYEGLLPVDLIIKDQLPYVEFRPSDPSEVYIWGSNSNFNLGLGNDLSCENPELLETFRRESISITRVILLKFYSVFLSNDGRVFTCGHGQGGCLGQNSELTVLTPKLVKGFGSLRVAAVSAGQHHMVLLTEEGQILTCGLNNYHQLGHLPPPGRLLLPRPISMKLLKGFEMVGCAAAKFHSVMYTKEAIFTFGLNAGQLGHPPGEKTQILPRQVASLIDKDVQITHVEASDGATVCATSKGDVYVLHEYLCRKIASRQIELKKICVVGGHLDPQCDAATLQESGSSELKVLLLTKSGKLFLWREENPVLRRCLFAQKHQIIISDMSLTVTALGLTSQSGLAFTGNFLQHKDKPAAKRDTKIPSSSNREDPRHKNEGIKSFVAPPVSLVPLLNHEDCEMIKLKRLPFIYRATGIACDSKGRNFAVIQSHPKTCLYELPLLSSSILDSDLNRFFQEISPDDIFHDVIIKVGKSTFLAHRYILSNRSEYLRKLISKTSTSNGNKTVLQLDHITADLFQHILEYIYTNTCLFLKEGHQFPVLEPIIKNENEQTQRETKNQKKKKLKESKAPNPNQIVLSNLIERSKEFGLKRLTECLQQVTIVDSRIKLKDEISLPKVLYNREMFPEFHDICLSSEDKDEFLCHRCILVARMSYFNSMLASGWIEATLIKPICIPLPSRILSIIIDYVYEDTSMKLYESEDAEFLCQVLVAADQYLIPRLKEICEVAVVDLITLKNACELLELSYIYNATQLKATCMQYICLNLAALIEMESLDVLSPEVMDELTVAYRNMVPGMNKRRLTPYTLGPSFEMLRQIATELPADPDEEILPIEVETKPKARRRLHSRRLSERTNEEQTAEKKEDVEIEQPPPVMSPITGPKSMIPTNSSPSVKPKRHIPFDGKWNVPVNDTPVLRTIMQAEAKALETKPSRFNRAGPKVLSNTASPPAKNVVPSAWSGVAHSPPTVSLSDFFKDSPKKTKESPAKANPWGNVGSAPTSPQSPVNPSPTPLMDEILLEESQILRQQAKTKSLDLIKIEEEAIQQLMIYYKADNNPEENITISRIGQIKTPAPSWRKC